MAAGAGGASVQARLDAIRESAGLKARLQLSHALRRHCEPSVRLQISAPPAPRWTLTDTTALQSRLSSLGSLIMTSEISPEVQHELHESWAGLRDAVDTLLTNSQSGATPAVGRGEPGEPP